MALNSDQLGKVISFQIIPSTVIANDFTGVRLVSIGHATAFPEFNPANMHFNVFSAIPDLPESYLDYNYAKVQFENGNFSIVGLPWIVEGSVSVQGSQVLSIEITGRSVSDIPALRRLLKSAGYDVASIVASEG